LSVIDLRKGPVTY